MSVAATGGELVWENGHLSEVLWTLPRHPAQVNVVKNGVYPMPEELKARKLLDGAGGHKVSGISTARAAVRAGAL